MQWRLAPRDRAVHLHRYRHVGALRFVDDLVHQHLPQQRDREPAEPGHATHLHPCSGEHDGNALQQLTGVHQYGDPLRVPGISDPVQLRCSGSGRRFAELRAHRRHGYQRCADPLREPLHRYAADPRPHTGSNHRTGQLHTGHAGQLGGGGAGEPLGERRPRGQHHARHAVRGLSVYERSTGSNHRFDPEPERQCRSTGTARDTSLRIGQLLLRLRDQRSQPAQRAGCLQQHWPEPAGRHLHLQRLQPHHWHGLLERHAGVIGLLPIHRERRRRCLSDTRIPDLCVRGHGDPRHLRRYHHHAGDLPGRGQWHGNSECHIGHGTDPVQLEHGPDLTEHRRYIGFIHRDHDRREQLRFAALHGDHHRTEPTQHSQRRTRCDRLCSERCHCAERKCDQRNRWRVEWRCGCLLRRLAEHQLHPDLCGDRGGKCNAYAHHHRQRRLPARYRHHGAYAGEQLREHRGDTHQRIVQWRCYRHGNGFAHVAIVHLQLEHNACANAAHGDQPRGGQLQRNHHRRQQLPDDAEHHRWRAGGGHTRKSCYHG